MSQNLQKDDAQSVAAQLHGIAHLIGERQLEEVTRVNAQVVSPGLNLPIFAHLLKTDAENLETDAKTLSDAETLSDSVQQELEAIFHRHVLPALSAAESRIVNETAMLDAAEPDLVEARRKVAEKVPMLEEKVQCFADNFGNYGEEVADCICQSFVSDFLKKVDTWGVDDEDDESDPIPRFNISRSDILLVRFSRKDKRHLEDELKEQLEEYFGNLVKDWTEQGFPRAFKNYAFRLDPPKESIERNLEDITSQLDMLEWEVQQELRIGVRDVHLMPAKEIFRCHLSRLVGDNIYPLLRDFVNDLWPKTLINPSLLAVGAAAGVAGAYWLNKLLKLIPKFPVVTAAAAVAIIVLSIAIAASSRKFKGNLIKQINLALRKARVEEEPKIREQIREALTEQYASQSKDLEDLLKAEIQSRLQNLAAISDKKREGAAAVAAEKERLATIGTLLTEHLEVISKKVLTHEEREALLVANTSLTHEG